jgi:hypothetical protein
MSSTRRNLLPVQDAYRISLSGLWYRKSLVYFYEGDWVKSFGFHLFGFIRDCVLLDRNSGLTGRTQNR